jgi:hypothetical protein
MGKRKGRGSTITTVASGDVGSLVFAAFTPEPSRSLCIYEREGEEIS